MNKFNFCIFFIVAIAFVCKFSCLKIISNTSWINYYYTKSTWKGEPIWCDSNAHSSLESTSKQEPDVTQQEDKPSTKSDELFNDNQSDKLSSEEDDSINGSANDSDNTSTGDDDSQSSEIPEKPDSTEQRREKYGPLIEQLQERLRGITQRIQALTDNSRWSSPLVMFFLQAQKLMLERQIKLLQNEINQAESPFKAMRPQMSNMLNMYWRNRA